MTSFDESKIRRGQPVNAGQFAAKRNSEPVGMLEDEPHPAPRPEQEHKLGQLVHARIARFNDTFSRAYVTRGNRPHVTDRLGMNVGMNIDQLDALRDEFDEPGIEGTFDFSRA